MIKRLMELVRARTSDEAEACKCLSAPCCTEERKKQSAEDLKAAAVTDSDLRIYFGGCC